MPDEDIERILVVSAHPDDVDFGAAGSVAVWTDAGIEVSYCIATDGEAGGRHTGIGPLELAELRRVEQTAAAKVVGVTDLTFLGYPDGRLVASLDLRRDITRVIRRVRPQRVLCQPPERNYQRIFASHPDHLACGDATLAAVYPDARNPFSHPELLDDEGLEPWEVREVYLTTGGADSSAVFVDITDTVDRKIEALLCHVSQMPDPEGTEARIRQWAAATVGRAGWPVGRFAEGFLARPHVMPTRLLVVRHGQSTWNSEGRWQGQADPPLSPLGEQQARDAAHHLARQATSDDSIDAVWSSDLQRAVRTAEIVAAALGLEVRLDNRLRERDAGEWQGLTRDEIEAEWPGFLAAGERPPGFEHDDALLVRVRAIVDQITGAQPGQSVLVVAHGGVVRTLERALGDDNRGLLPNLGGRWFAVDGRGAEPTLGARVLLLDEAEVTTPGQI